MEVNSSNFVSVLLHFDFLFMLKLRESWVLIINFFILTKLMSFTFISVRDKIEVSVLNTLCIQFE
jgi:hypothetical protein